MYKRILVANDGSPGALKALAAALATARSNEAELLMITVEELPRFPASIDEIDEKKRRQTIASLPLSPQRALTRQRRA